MTDYVTYFDPPSGWMYGFPKELPIFNDLHSPEKELKAWLLSCGYPKKDIDLAVKYSRMWTEKKVW